MWPQLTLLGIMLMGGSVWVFLLLASESIKTQKTNPNFKYITAPYLTNKPPY